MGRDTWRSDLDWRSAECGKVRSRITDGERQAMYARVVTFTDVEDFTGAMDFIRDEVVPALRAQGGYCGSTVSCSKTEAVLGILSLWESEATREASFSALADTRKKGGEVVGGKMSVETFEQLLVDLKEPPTVGSALSVTRFGMEPAAIDEHLAFFRSEILPEITASPGYLALRNLANRTSGDGLLGVVWKDEAARNAASDEAASRREKAVARGIRFGTISNREIALADLP
jgi:hypothetical protein